MNKSPVNILVDELIPSQGNPHELDLTTHHEEITNGLKSLRSLYKLSSANAKKHLESVYRARTKKIPSVISVFQEQVLALKSYILYLDSQKTKTKHTFTLLKCNHNNGLGWVQIEGFNQRLNLSFNPPTFVYEENGVEEFSCKMFIEKNQEIGLIHVDLYRKIAKLPVEQIAYCRGVSVFENFKSAEIDCCFCVHVELNGKDRIRILQIKFAALERLIEKLRADAQGNYIQNEFKPSCCDCSVI